MSIFNLSKLDPEELKRLQKAVAKYKEQQHQHDEFVFLPMLRKIAAKHCWK